MKIYPYIFSLLTCIGIALPSYAQVDRNETLIRSALHGLEYEIKAGFSIGGTAPLPLPVEIRSIDGYNPTLAISIGGERISGVWTGGVKTKVHTAGLTIPLMATYKLTNRWNIKAGPYFSYLLSREFSGHVYEGYLREDNPTGPKVEFTDGKIATYDFSDDLRHFQWGLQVGAGWRAFKHLNVYADLTWGLNDIFKNNFNTVTFAMYPIYLNIGFGYAF